MANPRAAPLLYLLSQREHYSLTLGQVGVLASFLPAVSKTLDQAWAKRQTIFRSSTGFPSFVRRRNGPSRRVLLDMLYFRNGIAMREVEVEYGVSRSTLSRRVNAILNALRIGPTMTLDRFLALASKKKRGPPPNTTGKKNDEILEALKELAVGEETKADTLLFYRNELVRKFPSLQGKLSISSVCRWLKHGLHISLKKATTTAVATLRPENVVKRDTIPRKWCNDVVTDEDGHVVYTREALKQWRLKPEYDIRQFHALDESGFNTTTGVRSKARAPIGKPAYCTRRHARSINHSLLPILSSDRGVIAWHYKPGGYNGDAFLAFLATKYLPAVAKYRQTMPDELRERRIYLIMDNCRIHHVQCVKTMLATVNVEPLFIPPYTPVLNPCELVFSEIKRAMRNEHYTDWNPRESMKKQCAQLKQRVIRHLEAVSSGNIGGYYRCCGWRQRDA